MLYPRDRFTKKDNRRRTISRRYYETLSRQAAKAEIRPAEHQLDLRDQILAYLAIKVDETIDTMRAGQSVMVDLLIEVINSDGSFRDGPSARNAPEATAWRKAVFERDNYTCQECGSTTTLNAHHIEPWSTAKNRRFDVSNGLTLCAPCHATKHPGLERVILAKRRRKTSADKTSASDKTDT